MLVKSPAPAPERTASDDILAFLTSSRPGDYGGNPEGKLPPLLRTPGLEALIALAAQCYAITGAQHDLDAYRAEIERAPLSAATRARLLAETTAVQDAITARINVAAADAAKRAADLAATAAAERVRHHVASDADLAWLRSWLPRDSRSTPNPRVAAMLPTGGVPCSTWLRRQLASVGAEWNPIGTWVPPADLAPRDFVRLRALENVARCLFGYGRLLIKLEVALAALTRKLTDAEIGQLMACRAVEGISSVDDQWRKLLGCTDADRKTAREAMADRE